MLVGLQILNQPKFMFGENLSKAIGAFGAVRDFMNKIFVVTSLDQLFGR